MTAFQIQMVLLLCAAFLLMCHVYFNNNSAKNNGGWAKEWAMEKNSHKFSSNKKLRVEAAQEDEEHGANFLIRFKNIRVKYRMEFANVCPNDTKLIMLSMARRDGFAKRKGVRQTWMNDSVPGEIIRFLVADWTPSEANDTQKRLEEEQAEHGDLVFLHGFEDKYKHIHLKWYAGLQWQQRFCGSAEWVMKTDDDAVVHLRRLAHWTDAKFRPIAEQNPLVYIGLILYNPSPIRDKNSKWYISEDVYPLDWYPSFMQGTIYLTTPATIRAVLAHTKEIVGFYLDDVLFTGILAELANVKLCDQRKHFMLDFNLIDDCINGTPTALSVYGVKDFNGYAREYGRLNSIKCRLNI